MSCAASASALGSTFGIFVLVALIPFATELILVFGALEMLMLILWGLALVSTLVRSSPLRGLAAAVMGLAVSAIGLDYNTAEPRMTYESLFLLDGPPVVIIFLSMFAVAEVLDLAHKSQSSVSRKYGHEQLLGSVKEGLFSVLHNFGLFLRCSVIGTVVGIIPGIGSLVAGFVAYSHAANTPGGRFGRGDVRGVLAPEAANDAKDGGSLVPLLAFGIPGGVTSAMFLEVLHSHGIAPGRSLMTQNIVLVFVLIWSLFLSNWLTSIVGLSGVRWFARITTLKAKYLAPVILLLIAISAYGYRGSLIDLWICMGCGLVGWYMKHNHWPRVPFVIALVLGEHLESNLLLAIRLVELDRLGLSGHPVALGIGLLAISALLLPVMKGKYIAQRKFGVESTPVISIVFLFYWQAWRGSYLLSVSAPASFLCWPSVLRLSL